MSKFPRIIFWTGTNTSIPSGWSRVTTDSDLTAKLKQAKANKYHAKKTVVDGIVFDSKKEAKRYGELKLMEKAELISQLELQPRKPLHINGILVGHYTPDFSYLTPAKTLGEFSHRTYEEVKGYRTKDYVLRRKVFEAIYGVNVVET